MKRFILTAALLGGFFACSATEARALECARGVYRAGCVGPRGAVVGHRGYYGGVYPGGVYPGGVYPGDVYHRGGAYRNIGPNQITPNGSTIPGGR
jgi:hypothetical protein